MAKGRDEAGRTALKELCAAYYEPVVAFVRSEGRSDDAARELAHAFFEMLLSRGSLGGADPQRGRFRSYLLGAVKHFLRDHRVKHEAEKRGAGRPTVLMEDTDGGSDLPDPSGGLAERAFDRQWALTIMARALGTVGDEFRASGRSAQFEALKPWITGSARQTQAEVAEALGMNSGAVKVAVHRLRQRFREEIKSEIAQTLHCPDDAADELRHLVDVLTDMS